MRYGRFLYAMLETMMSWHSSKDTFEKECAQYPGFITKYRASEKPSNNLDRVDYGNYRHVCHKWHCKLAKAMVTCLESKDYVQIRNALIILTKIIPYFPVLTKLSTFLDKKIEKIRDEEKNKRQDLFTLASSYLGLLKQRVSGGHMMEEKDFHQVADKEKVKTHKPEAASSTKQNGEAKTETDATKESSKEKSERKSSRQPSEDSKVNAKPQASDRQSVPVENSRYFIVNVI